MTTIDQIITGNAVELAERYVEPGSVDMIFTDPPYLKEFLPLYGWLATEGVRAIKPGGYLFAYTGCEHLERVIILMAGKGLNYFWTDALTHAGGNPRMWYKKLMVGYKPILVYTKGKPSRLVWRGTLHKDERSKDFHKWGQGIGTAVKLIELLTDPGALVYDPFMGGGTTAAACKITGRHYIGFELDAEQATIARQRVQAQNAPLITLDAGWAQGELIKDGKDDDKRMS